MGVKGDGEVTRDWVPTTSFQGLCDADAWALAGSMGAIERRAIAGGGGDGAAYAEAYFVFSDADQAVAYMGRIRDITRGCIQATSGGSRGLVEGLAGPWGEGLAAGHASAGESVGGGPVVLAVRSGRAVALSASAGPFQAFDQIDSMLVRTARPAVEHLYPQLCRYTRAGC